MQIDTDGQVSLQRLPRLTTVHSNTDGLTLHMENTPAVERVSGSGSILNLKQPVASATRLTINGGWKHARIFSPQLTTLHFANGHSLSLHDCGALKNVEVPHGIEVDCEGALPAPLVGFAHFYFNESSLNSCMQQFMQGDLSQLDGILSVLAKAHQRSQVAVTLQKLAELCHLGVAPERVWQTRRELAARHLSYGRKKPTGTTALAETALRKADARWHWALPQDLAPQGWEADLKIWCYCQRSLPRGPPTTRRRSSGPVKTRPLATRWCASAGILRPSQRCSLWPSKCSSTGFGIRLSGASGCRITPLHRALPVCLAARTPTKAAGRWLFRSSSKCCPFRA